MAIEVTISNVEYEIFSFPNDRETIPDITAHMFHWNLTMSYYNDTEGINKTKEEMNSSRLRSYDLG